MSRTPIAHYVSVRKREREKKKLKRNRERERERERERQKRNKQYRKGDPTVLSFRGDRFKLYNVSERERECTDFEEGLALKYLAEVAEAKQKEASSTTLRFNRLYYI